VIDGYLNQSKLLAVACEAVMHRADQERVSLILEGVHVLPSLLERVPRGTDVIAVMAMTGVLDPEELKRRIQGRGGKQPGRRARRYLKYFDAIWQLQSYILSEADKAHVAIVTNDDFERAARELITTIADELARHFEPSVDAIFG